MYVARGNTIKEVLADIQQKGKPEAIAKGLREYLGSGQPVSPRHKLASKPKKLVERRGLGGGDVPDIGSESNPVKSQYGLPAYRKNGFWWIQGYSMSGSGEKEWSRITDPKSQNEIDALYTGAETSLQSVHDSRSELSKSSDERQEHSLVVEPDDPRVERWMRDAGSMDVRGIDTPAKRKVGSKKPKAKPKRRTDNPTSVRGIRR